MTWIAFVVALTMAGGNTNHQCVDPTTVGTFEEMHTLNDGCSAPTIWLNCQPELGDCFFIIQVKQILERQLPGWWKRHPELHDYGQWHFLVAQGTPPVRMLIVALNKDHGSMGTGWLEGDEDTPTEAALNYFMILEERIPAILEVVPKDTGADI